MRDELGQPTGSYEISAGVFDVKPRSRGRLRLRSADPLAPPSIEHGFLSDPTDLAVLVDGVELVRRLAACQPARAFARRETRPGPAAYVEDYGSPRRAGRHACSGEVVGRRRDRRVIWTRLQK